MDRALKLGRPCACGRGRRAQ